MSNLLIISEWFNNNIILGFLAILPIFVYSSILYFLIPPNHINLVKCQRYFIGGLLSPMLVLYKLKFIPNYKAKQYLLSWYFKDIKKEDFFQVANKYSLNHIDKIVRKKAIDRINWHKKQGDKIVVVSASIDCWLRPWCNINNLELIATKLDLSEDKITGNFLTKNCYGQEKVNRINETYNLKEFNLTLETL